MSLRQWHSSHKVTGALPVDGREACDKCGLKAWLRDRGSEYDGDIIYPCMGADYKARKSGENHHPAKDHKQGASQ